MRKILLSLMFVVLATWASAQIVVTGEILSNTTWTSNNIYLLNGWVYVRAGATLTIEPGTIIKGDFVSKGALIIERDAMLMADGTAEEPIVFTSQKAVGERNYGDWGGVIICGRASVNAPANAGNGTVAGEAIIEGGVGSVYGGGANPDDDDNSGILRYVRIEFGGIPFQPNSEINGLTMGGVGRGTTIENVQVSYSGDDAFEWFGGTVNCKNLVSYRNWDDDFDTDFGFRGNIQFGVVVRDPSIADQSGSNGFESDNDATGTTNTPITQAKFSNITVLGPLVNSDSPNSNYKRALHLRRNTQTSVFNSVFTGYPTGLLIDGSSTHTNAINGDLKFMNSVIAAMQDSLATTSNANPNNISGSFDISNWFATAAFSNSIVNATGDLMFNNTSISSPDLTLMDGSPLMNGAAFTDSYLQDNFFTEVSYRGAFGTDNWATCWTEWDPQNESYNQAINNSITASISVNGSATVCDGESVTLEIETSDENAMIQWSNNETTSSITVLAPATVTAIVTNSNGCSVATASVDLATFPVPTVNISADGQTSFCTGSSVVLTSSQGSGNVWSNDATSNSITVSESGVYNLVYMDDNGCMAMSNSIDVSVSDAPVPTITTGGLTTFCDGESVSLNASASDSYQWFLNGEELDNETSQTIDATEAGAYSVVVTNADQCDGVGTSSNVFVTVNQQPEAAFDFDADFNSFVYEFNNNSINATSYSWDFGDGNTSNEANPTHTFTTAGAHNVTLTATNGDCEDVYTMNISNVSVQEQMLTNAIVIYPNPAAADVTLSLSVNGSNDVLVTIYDVSGKLVHSLSVLNATGNQVIILPAASLNDGIYFVRVNIGNSNEMLRLIVNK